MIKILTNKTELKRKAQNFIEHEASGGVILILAALLALILSNSYLSPLYHSFLEIPVAIQIGALSIDKPLLLWVNDGLMAIFFFLVGLEIKREIVEGELSSVRKASLPVIAAVGGMLVPALIYVAFNYSDPTALKGWAIPAATDIAFALGILALLGPRVPVALKVFLLALAIIDDLGAIIIIAVFYTSELSLSVLAIAAVGISVLGYLNHRGVMRIAPYVVTGLVIWVCVLKSGVHATLAGVVVALFIPIRTGGSTDGSKELDKGESVSPLKSVEHNLSPWVSFGVMPLFAFANAGVTLKTLSFSDLFGGIPLGIALGLFLGKQIGIMSFTWASVRMGLARLPDGITWLQIYGVSALAGIGFTMSLFIGTLAFADPAHAASVRVGVLTGSITSALVGIFILRFALKQRGSSAVDKSVRQTSTATRQEA